MGLDFLGLALSCLLTDRHRREELRRLAALRQARRELPGGDVITSSYLTSPHLASPPISSHLAISSRLTSAYPTPPRLKPGANCQYTTSFGDFEPGSGELCVEASPSEVVRIDTKNRMACMDGRFVHWVGLSASAVIPL